MRPLGTQRCGDGTGRVAGRVVAAGRVRVRVPHPRAHARGHLVRHERRHPEPLRQLLQRAGDLPEELLPLRELPAAELRPGERGYGIYDEQPHAAVDERLLQAVQPLEHLRQRARGQHEDPGRQRVELSFRVRGVGGARRGERFGELGPRNLRQPLRREPLLGVDEHHAGFQAAASSRRGAGAREREAHLRLPRARGSDELAYRSRGNAPPQGVVERCEMRADERRGLARRRRRRTAPGPRAAVVAVRVIGPRVEQLLGRHRLGAARARHARHDLLSDGQVDVQQLHQVERVARQHVLARSKVVGLEATEEVDVEARDARQRALRRHGGARSAPDV